jgi:hypothetical protein
LGVAFNLGVAGSSPPPPPPVGQSVYANSPGAKTTAEPANADAGSDLDSTFDNLDVVDSSLEGKLAVLRVGSELGPTNLLSIFAGLKNKTSHRLNLEVQTIYKDKDGNALNAGSWIAFALKAHEEREYHSASISEAAVDFLVRVRRAAN